MWCLPFSMASFVIGTADFALVSFEMLMFCIINFKYVYFEFVDVHRIGDDNVFIFNSLLTCAALTAFPF